VGLLDVLTGMSNGPRGGSGGGHGVSPLVMAALGLLAYKAVKGMGAEHPPPSQSSSTPSVPPARPSGSLGDILGSLGLGGGATPAADSVAC
jgi:hypothetical protein